MQRTDGMLRSPDDKTSEAKLKEGIHRSAGSVLHRAKIVSSRHDCYSCHIVSLENLPSYLSP